MNSLMLVNVYILQLSTIGCVILFFSKNWEQNSKSAMYFPVFDIKYAKILTKRCQIIFSRKKKVSLSSLLKSGLVSAD